MDNCIRTKKRVQMIARGFVSIEYQMKQTLTININISLLERLMHSFKLQILLQCFSRERRGLHKSSPAICAAVSSQFARQFVKLEFEL